ncbi:MAG: hypothetical protein RLZZ127_342 [Planctomycetota bacterium]|jgi:prepilin-type N-terminal cleavage/methylation domain-containing protein
MTPQRSGFSLIELLVATAIIVVLLALVFIIWRGTQQAVERARAVIQLDLRARDIANRALFSLDNRSGVLPLALQNDAYGSQWPYRIYAFMANAERGAGSGSQTTRATTRDTLLNLDLPQRWSREPTPAEKTNGAFLGWRTPGAESATDAYAAGKDVLIGVEGNGAGFRWAPAPIAMWHGTVVPIDAGKRYLTGASYNLQWAVLTTKGQYSGTAHLQGGMSPDYRSMHPFTPGLHYRGGFQSLGSTAANLAIHGPYRGTLVIPWRMFQNSATVAVPWLGERVAFRAVNGPGFLLEPAGRTNPAWMPIQTGINGGIENGLARLEPDWYDGALANPVRSGPQPAYGSVVQDNSVVWRVEAPNLYAFGPAAGPRDSGSDINYGWRLQRVLLESSSVTSISATRSYLGVIAPHALINAGVHNIKGSGGQDSDTWDFNPDVNLLQPNYFFGTGFTPILSSPFRQNVSEFRTMTGKTRSPAGIPAAARGIFGTLVVGARTAAVRPAVGTNANTAVVPWTDDAVSYAALANPGVVWHLHAGTARELFSVNTRSFVGDGETIPAAENPWRSHLMGQFHAAAFHGSIPSALAPPGHPAWGMVTIGVVGGFTNRVGASHLDTRPRDADGVPDGPLVTPNAIERRWTLGTGLR